MWPIKDRKFSSDFPDITTHLLLVSQWLQITEKGRVLQHARFLARKIQTFWYIRDTNRINRTFCVKIEMRQFLMIFAQLWFFVQFVFCWFVFEDRQQRRNLQRKIKTAKPSISLPIIIRFKGHSKIFFQTFWDHLQQ